MQTTEAQGRGAAAPRLPGRFFARHRALSRLMHRYAWTVPIVAALGVTASALEGFGIGLLIPLISTMLEAEGAKPGVAALGPLARFLSWFGERARLPTIGGTILIFVVLRGLVQMANRHLIAWADGKLGHEIRCASAQRILGVGYPFFIRQDPGRIVNVIASETWRAVEAIRARYTLVAAAAAATIFACFLLAVSWKMSIAVGAGVVLIRLLRARLSRGIEALGSATASANNALGERMLLIVGVARLIRLFGQEARQQSRFDEASEQVRRATLAVEAVSARVEPAFEIAHAALFVVVLIGAYRLGVDVPVIVTFLVLLYRMQPHLRIIEHSRIQLASLVGAVQEVEWLLDPTGKPASPAGKRPFPELREGIAFQNVSFSYESGTDVPPALTLASFVIPKGRATALIGPSGSGKSTIVNLLLRLHEPTAGRILIDGEDLANLNPTQWRESVAFAGQDVEFIDGTIYDNIALGRADASRADVEAAARGADADGFIRQLPDGYATVLASGGLNLSNGQRQRIGLARALVRDPQLLILDEATNAIDGVSEAVVLATLKERARRTTTLVISHRASTVAACDQRIAIDGGRVVDAGLLTRG